MRLEKIEIRLVLYNYSLNIHFLMDICYTVFRYCGLVQSSYHLMVFKRL